MQLVPETLTQTLTQHSHGAVASLALDKRTRILRCLHASIDMITYILAVNKCRPFSSTATDTSENHLKLHEVVLRVRDNSCGPSSRQMPDIGNHMWQLKLRRRFHSAMHMC